MGFTNGRQQVTNWLAESLISKIGAEKLNLEAQRGISNLLQELSAVEAQKHPRKLS